VLDEGMLEAIASGIENPIGNSWVQLLWCELTVLRTHAPIFHWKP
jgi:hypothetical protein